MSTGRPRVGWARRQQEISSLAFRPVATPRQRGLEASALLSCAAARAFASSLLDGKASVGVVRRGAPLGFLFTDPKNKRLESWYIRWAADRMFVPWEKPFVRRHRQEQLRVAATTSMRTLWLW